jgi:hypothetical protein
MSSPDIFMKIPVDAIIAREKLTQYLLVPRQKNDKSGFLAQVGFTLQNPEALEEAIRALIAENEAVTDRDNEYGIFYRVEGDLHGPYGILSVVTVWILRTNDNRYRFITLKPAR